MKKDDILEELKNQLKNYIEEHHRSVEEFCWDKEVNKATVSNFLNSKKDFRVSTLAKMAKAMGKRLNITAH